VVISLPGFAAEKFLRLATTTSTENSGLLAVLHPPFEQQNKVKVHVIAAGTGNALKLGENGDVDVVLVHAPAAEIEFVEKGFGVARLPVMHNDFILIGPASDPADVRSAPSLNAAMLRIAGTKTGFVSRGDDSGTHKRELSLWDNAAIVPAGDWYMAVGQGMGAVLQIADDKQVYTLTDRGTYLAYKDKIDSVIMYQGASELFNPYHVIMVNPGKHPQVKSDLANRYIEYVRGEQGQEIIRNYKISGKQLFFPDVIH
jgi:tungstate transport system substrate-binding protein